MKLYAIASTLFVLLAGYSWAAPGVQQQANVSPAKAASGGDSSYRPTESTPLPVRLIESEKEVAEKQAREAKSDKHEADDLVAQVRTADAAERQVILGWFALVLSAVGTFAVLYTLKLSRRGLDAAVRSADAAEEAAKSAQQMAKASVDAFQGAERAWMHFDGVVAEPVGEVIHVDNCGFYRSLAIKVRWVNGGRTPALKCGAHAFPKQGGKNRAADPNVAVFGEIDRRDWDKKIAQNTVIGPGGQVFAQCALGYDFLAELDYEIQPLYVYSKVFYRDIFTDELRSSEVSLRVLYIEKTDTGEVTVEFQRFGTEQQST